MMGLTVFDFGIGDKWGTSPVMGGNMYMSASGFRYGTQLWLHYARDVAWGIAIFC